MNGNTAIFYDIENLLKGYSSSRDYIGSISLKAVFAEIKKLEIVKRIAVQKAYANWSDPRLSVMKREINELGIDPIQIFGFSQHQKKNAADIQLAVDSIDLAYVRNQIDIFVVVSGDGGFSAVAKKLHEYGKYVIGCGYKSSTNQILESVCDYYIRIDEPEDIEPEKSEIEKTLKITNPFVLRMSQSIERLATDNRSAIIQQSLNIIRWFTKDVESARELSHNGLHLSVVKEAFKYGIQNFDPAKIGLSKFVQFLQFICRNTDLKVMTSNKYETKIAFKDANLENLETLPYLDENYLHSLENYQSILTVNHPRLRIIEIENSYKIISFISSLANKTLTLDDILEEINNLYPEIESTTINQFIFSLAAIEIFEIPDREKSLSEQFFSVRPQYAESKNIVDKLKETIETKLSSFWGDELKQDVVRQILALNTDETNH